MVLCVRAANSLQTTPADGCIIKHIIIILIILVYGSSGHSDVFATEDERSEHFISWLLLDVNKQSVWGSTVTLRAHGESLITQHPLCQTSVSALTCGTIKHTCGWRETQGSHFQPQHTRPTFTSPLSLFLSLPLLLSLTHSKLFSQSEQSLLPEKEVGLVCEDF